MYASMNSCSAWTESEKSAL